MSQEPAGPGSRPSPAAAPPQPDAILARCRAWLPEMTEALAELVSMETPSTEPATLELALRWLEERFAALGMACERVPGRETAGYLIARSSELAERPLQLLIGHCDTVWPVGTLARMPVRIEEGRLHGPGSFDMKAGLVQTLFALQALREGGHVLPVAPVMLVNTDEEIGSFESSAAIGRLAREADRCFVMEPSLAPDGRLKTRRKGVAQYDLRVRGKAAHAGLNPEEGVSAILELSAQVQRVFALNDRERGISVNVGRIEGGTRPNVIAPAAHAVIDVRACTRDDAARVDAALHGLEPTRPGVTLEVESLGGRPPLEPRASGRLLWERARALAGHMGLELAEGMAGGGSDGNQTNLHTPTLDGLGAVGDGAHSDHEHVILDAMPERAALLALLLAEPPVAELDSAAGSSLGEDG